MDVWLNEALFAAGSAFLLGVYSLVRGPRQPTNQSFAGFLLTAGVLCLGVYGAFGAQDAEEAARWADGTRWAFVFIPAFFLSFCLHFAGVSRRIRRPAIATGFALSGAAALLSVMGLMVEGFVRQGRYLKPDYGPLYYVFVGWVALAGLAGVAALLWADRTADAYQRNRRRLFCLAMVIGLVLGLASFFLMHQVERPVTPFAVLVASPLVAYAFLRHRLLSVTSYVRLGATSVLVLVLLSPIYLVVLTVIAHLHGGLEPMVAVFLLLVFATVAAMVPKVRTWSTHAILERLRLRGRVDRDALVAGMRRLMATGNVAETARQLAELMREVTGAKRCLVHVHRSEQPGWILLGSDVAAGSETEAPRLGDAACDWLLSRCQVTLRQDLTGLEDKTLRREVGAWMDTVGVDLVLPTYNADAPRALTMLGAPGGEGMFEPHDLASLEAASELLAVALEANWKAEQLEADRQLESISRTVAGIAHEFRNSLIPTRTFLELVPERLDDPAFLSDYRLLALEQLDRSFLIIRQLRDLHLTRAPLLVEQDVLGLVAACVEGLTPTARQRGVDLQLTSTEPAMVCAVDAELLAQALSNLLLNAIEHARAGDVRVELTRSRIGHDARQPRALLSISNPEVIPPHALPHVFVPFFTTRTETGREGTGLGLPIAQRIVRAHGGTLAVHSSAPKGTIFTIALPVEDDAAIEQPGLRGRGEPPITESPRLATGGSS